ncbi:hypothetical protein TNCV_2046181 [Trichonephila clavipes]|uniref:Uncharacterized protein n=1 Tax=Trichonephila clavipes TaxID=2585209 RepID=A0A8X6SQR0_TRICX|nr:hypothetical protein TNCV_2046181 [Trichonephila clavipes]
MFDSKYCLSLAIFLVAYAYRKNPSSFEAIDGIFIGYEKQLRQETIGRSDNWKEQYLVKKAVGVSISKSLEHIPYVDSAVSNSLFLCKQDAISNKIPLKMKMERLKFKSEIVEALPASPPTNQRQLALTLHGERQLRRILRIQRSSTLAQITTQLNGVPVVQSVNGLCNTRFTVWVSGAVDLREYQCSMLAVELHVLPGQEAQRLECREQETSSME